MSLIKKLFTLFRGVAHEGAQAAVDAKALTIIDQEMRDATSQLAASKVELTKLMGKATLGKQKIDANARKLAEYGNYVSGALSKGDQALAREVAEKMAPLKVEQETEIAAHQALEQNIQVLHNTIRKTEAKLKAMKVQVDQARATEAVQKAQSSIASRTAGTHGQMASALDSLERLTQRQAERGAQLAAAEQLELQSTDDGLNQRLAAAGLLANDSSVDAILAQYASATTKQLSHDSAALPPPASTDPGYVTVVHERAGKP